LWTFAARDDIHEGSNCRCHRRLVDRSHRCTEGKIEGIAAGHRGSGWHLPELIPQPLHFRTVCLICSGISSKHIICERENDIEILVLMSVMKIMMPSQKLVDWPFSEELAFRLVHLKVDLVPNPVM